MELTLALRKPAAPDAPDAPFAPGPPRINLLPTEARERVLARRDKRVAIAAASAAVVVVGAVAGTSYLTNSSLRDDIAAAEIVDAEASRQMAVYAPVTNVAAQSSALMQTVEAQSVDLVLHGPVYERVLKVIGDVGTVKALSLTTGANAACVTTDPFDTALTVGCLSFTVQSASGASGAPVLVERLQQDAWFTDAFIPSVSETSEDGVFLSGTAAITASAVAVGQESTGQGEEGEGEGSPSDATEGPSAPALDPDLPPAGSGTDVAKGES